MKVKIKKLYKDSVLPTKAHTTDAGYDMYAHSKSYDNDGNVVYGSGVAMEIPKGYVGLLFPRSSNAKKDLLLSDSVGVIDSGFRGEISFKFKASIHASRHEKLNVEVCAFVNKPATYNISDRIGQIIIMPYPEIEFVEVEELSDSERGKGGYGSSGR